MNVKKNNRNLKQASGAMELGIRSSPNFVLNVH